MPCFVEFHLLKQSKYEDLEAWTKSEAFGEANLSAGGSRRMRLNGPHFEGFGVIAGAKGGRPDSLTVEAVSQPLTDGLVSHTGP